MLQLLPGQRSFILAPTAANYTYCTKRTCTIDLTIYMLVLVRAYTHDDSMLFLLVVRSQHNRRLDINGRECQRTATETGKDTRMLLHGDLTAYMDRFCIYHARPNDRCARVQLTGSETPRHRRW